MHIGVDATVWSNSRGYGRQARALLTALVNHDLENHYTLILDSPITPVRLPELASVRVARVSQPTVSAAAAKSARSMPNLWQVSKLLSAKDFDILLFPTVYSYLPVISKAKKILIIHDIIPEKFPQLTLPSFSSRLFWKMKSALGRWQADAIVTVSEYSRQLVSEFFDIPSRKIYVVGEAGDKVFRKIDHPQFSKTLLDVGVKEGQRLIVYVGGFGPHKNLSMLVDVFFRITCQHAYDDLSLVLVGETHNEAFHTEISDLMRQVNALGLSDRVIFTGYLPDDDLVILLNKATLMVLPSLMEGFGLPAIEAAACGCPVVATCESPLPEILGNSGIFINPYHQNELEQAVKAVLDSPEKQVQMAQDGIKVAHSYSWQDAALQMESVFREVMKN